MQSLAQIKSQRHRKGYQTSYMADYKPPSERGPRLYRLHPRPPGRPATSTPKKMEEEWTQYQQKRSRSSSSSYSSSTFAQKGKNLVATLLEKSHTPSSCGSPTLGPQPGDQPRGTPRAPLQRSPGGQVLLETKQAHRGGERPGSGLLPPATPHGPLHCSPPSSSSSPSSSPSPTPPPTPPSAPGSPQPERPAAAPPAARQQEPVTPASRLRLVPSSSPSEEGSGWGSPAQGEGDTWSYEAYLKDSCRSAKLQSLLNRRIMEQSVVLQQGLPFEGESIYRRSFQAWEVPAVPFRASQPRPQPCLALTWQYWRPWMSEYNDKYGQLLRSFSSGQPWGRALKPTASQPRVALAPRPPRRSQNTHYLTEYQESFRPYRELTSRPRSCPGYRLNQTA
ncbi:proline-rich protein 12-like [Lepisosteus oculatus]|uniref:proline-rich protein 12-like n=1 Tax=Lepisosteus oculatus TaxID=7918 RepID=UPI0035F51744